MVEKIKPPTPITELSEVQLTEFEKQTRLYVDYILSLKDGWKQHSPVGKTEIFSRPGITSALTVLCKRILNCSLKDACVLIQQDEEAAKIINKKELFYVVDKLFDKYYLLVLQLLDIGPLISNRYIFFVSYEDYINENEILIWGGSIDAPVDFSSYGIAQKKDVRGRMPIFAWHLKKISEKETEIAYLTETSLEGSIPTSFVNSGTIKSVGPTLENYYKYLLTNEPKNTSKFLLKK